MKKISVVLLVLLLGVSIVGCSQSKKEEWKPKANTVTLEYGETKTLNSSKFIAKNEEEVSFVKFDIEVPTEKIEIDKKEVDTFKIGTYKGYLIVEDKDKEQSKHEITVKVKDTTPPKFVDFKKEIKIAVGTDNIKLENYFMAEDLSDVAIEVKGDVDFKTEGTYDITVTATDAHGNKTDEQSSVVIVISKEDADKDGVTEIVSQTDENGNIIGATDEQIQNNTNMQTGGSQSGNENNNTGTTGNGTGSTGNGSGQGSQSGSNNTGGNTGSTNTSGGTTGGDTGNSSGGSNGCELFYPPTDVNAVGALGEKPTGLLSVTQGSDAKWHENYSTSAQAKARGDDLKARGLVRGFNYESESGCGIYSVSFYLK